jgi:hypothetical protein
MATDLNPLNAELRKLRENGLVLPRHSGRALSSYGDTYESARDFYRAGSDDLRRIEAKVGRPVTADNYDSPDVQQIINSNRAHIRDFAQRRPRMGDNVRMSSRGELRQKSREQHYGSVSSIGGDVVNAVPRFYDPLEYWDISGLPWNVEDEGHRHKLHKWLRLYYATHYLVPILVDIFTRFPLVGMELTHKDPQLVQFYEDLFFDQLDYPEFLVSLGREFWVVGEAYPLGSFDEDLGVWEREELINPEDIVVENFPMLDSTQLKIKPPDYLKRIVQTRNPAREYRILQSQYEDLIPYLQRGENIPVSPVLIRQVANKLTDWDNHGTPILLRGLRTLLHEEKLLASQDAIAERLYSPLILAKLGIMDMGDHMPPFIPGAEELDSVRDDLDVALASDFRVMVHHFGLDITNVFGREQMPRLGDDFDRIEKRLMQLFGVNPSLLSAGSGGQPYASSALQAEFLNQILRTFQNVLKRHYRERALVVAEAQGHYEYEKKGDKRIPVFETVVKFDEEGNKSFEEVPKLTVPDMEFQTLDLRDEATERQFLQDLRAIGVPIPDDKMLVGVSWKGKDMVEDYNKELMEKTIAQQRAKMQTYIALSAMGLPIPQDLRAEVETVLQAGPGAPSGSGAPIMGGPAGGPPGAGGGLVPGVTGPGGGPGPIVMPPAPPGGGPPATAPMQPGPAGTVPQVSNERRPGLTYNTSTKPKDRNRRRIHTKIARPSALHDMILELGDDVYSEEYGVPFEDFLADQEGVEYDYNKLHELNESQLEEARHDWPSHAAAYRTAIANEIAWRFAAQLTESEEDDTLADSEDFTLGYNQELQNEGSKDVRILEKRAKKRIVVDLPKAKKYSIIDPEAEPLDDGTESTEGPEDIVAGR